MKGFFPWSTSPSEAYNAAPCHAVQSPASQHNILQVFRVPLLKGLKLYEITIDELQGSLSDKRFTSVDLVHFCIERIRCVCAQELTLWRLQTC